MRFRHAGAALAALALVSCSESALEPLPSASVAQHAMVVDAGVRVSEIHYDNASTDVGERIEVSGPAGMSLAGWRVVLYNGSNGTTYGTINLSGTMPATCGDRGVVVHAFANIQNGDPDGWALIDPSNAVVEFKSWGGTFTATNGLAIGLLSTDIGIRQSSSAPIGSSISRDFDGVWTATVPAGTNTFGSCNDLDDGGDEPGPVASVTLSPGQVSLAPGQTAQFTAFAKDANGVVIPNAPIVFYSTNPLVAGVDATGLVTARAGGVVNIMAVHATANFGAGAYLAVSGAAAPVIGISEIHYDNASTDVGEAVEIEAPAGMDMTGWRILPYNGGNGATYTPTGSFSGVVPDQCSGRGTMSVAIAGLQNDADGLALVNPANEVIDFISYEAQFRATNGPANGQWSEIIGVSESGTATPAGHSLQRVGMSWTGPMRDPGTWIGPRASSFGDCNVAPPPPPQVVITELMADPFRATGGSSWGEWFEVYNAGALAVDLQGWTIATGGGSSQPSHVIAQSLLIPPGAYVVLGRGADITRNGGVTLDYNYFSGNPSTTIYLDDTDFLELLDGAGNSVDRVQWGSSTTMARGSTRALRDLNADNGNADNATWGYSTTTFGDGDYGTPGAPNGTLSDTPAAVPNSIAFTGRVPGDGPVPAGFEAQVFAELHDGATGNDIPTTITWTSETPDIATIDQDGVFHVLDAGSAVFRATAADGTTATYVLPTSIAVAGGTAQYADNDEFGVPTDGNDSDDFLIERTEYTSSWSSTRNTPNWVSYNLDASHIGGQDRCNCFTFDPELTTQRYTTGDYTGATAFHGYGIDRGHLARSFDRTTGTLDNARTFYFSNIIPQASDNNQGPWAVLETHLGNLAQNDNREVYITAGVAGNKGTIKNEGLIVIPEYTWKVAVIMPRDNGLADVDSKDDVQVIAVIMPNVAGIRNVPWQTYQVTVDEVEALSGYDVLRLLPDHIEIAVESNTSAPVAVLDAPATSLEGSTVSMTAAASTDADNDALTYSWSFGDGGTAAGSAVSHTYAQDGTYTVQLVVTDTRTLADTVTSIVTVGNVAPSVAAFAGAALVQGETYTAAGSFTDPGADSWTATVDYGDGGGATALALGGGGFTLSHVYATAGTFTVTVRIMDGVDVSTRTATVTVLTPAQSLAGLIAMLQQMAADGDISRGNANALKVKLDAAAAQLANSNDTPAVNQLEAFINQLDALAAAGRISAADAAALRAAAERVISAIEG